MNGPRTIAGRDLVADMPEIIDTVDDFHTHESFGAAIRYIEDRAIELERRRIILALEVLPGPMLASFNVARRDVLRIVSGVDDKGGPE